MQKILSFILKPYQEKGILIGTIDNAIKLITLFVWCYLVYILGGLLVESFTVDYNPLNKLWWVSYCFLLFFGSSWISYILLFVRDYNNN